MESSRKGLFDEGLDVSMAAGAWQSLGVGPGVAADVKRMPAETWFTPGCGN
jgi:hypothetical protein